MNALPSIMFSSFSKKTTHKRGEKIDIQICFICFMTASSALSEQSSIFYDKNSIFYIKLVLCAHFPFWFCVALLFWWISPSQIPHMQPDVAIDLPGRWTQKGGFQFFFPTEMLSLPATKWNLSIHFFNAFPQKYVYCGTVCVYGWKLKVFWKPILADNLQTTNSLYTEDTNVQLGWKGLPVKFIFVWFIMWTSATPEY